MSFGWVTPSNVPNMTSWPAQNYTVTLNVTQPNAHLKVTEITLYRVDSNGGPGTAGIAHVADKSGLSQSLGTAGTYTWTLSGTAQTANATDRFGIKFIVSYSGTTTTSFGYLGGSGSGSGVNVAGSGTLPSASTGLNPWWTYYAGKLPGQGTYALNVGNGNLVAKMLDSDTPERGIDLAFQRTYNSLSTHDANNTDGSVPGAYGDGWTSSFDAHLAYHGSNTISVYDIDGTRFDYTADGSGHWTPPTGQYASLKWDGACGYQWFKTNGTVYYFYSPDLNEATNCSITSPTAYPSNAGYGGRLYQIWARNYNNKITFSYSWTGSDASSPSNLTGIAATHSDGDKISLSFGTVNGAPELSSVTRPDGKVIHYAYSGNDLSEVDLPGTNGPGSSAIATVKETYGYGSPHTLTTVYSPVYNDSNSSMGNETTFQYDASNRVKQAADYGKVNFIPSDSTGTALQSGQANFFQTWTTTNFSWLSGETQLSDMFGHYVNWFSDSNGRVTEIQRWSATPSGAGLWLSAAQSWDASNNLLSAVDPRGMVGSTPDPTYETDYAYDTVGDLVAAAQPSVTLNNGTYRPTYVYSYDSNHNATAICDPVESHALALDWSGSGQGGNPGTSSTRCPSSTGAVRYSWDTSDTNEPHGRISDYYSASGYHVAVAYNASSEANVDAGLPTSFTGATISQSSDSTTPTRTPTQTMTYDASGSLLSMNNGTGTTTYAYNAMHRPISATDADNVATYTCYNDNGTVFFTETASQHAADGSPGACSTPLPSSTSAPTNAVSYTYDADGNSTAQLHHYGNITGTTTRWYDAGDRLVEVQLPLDSTVFPNTTIPHDLYPKPWMARYLYDNTGGMLWSDGSGNGVYGLGHLYKTQEYLPSTPVIAANTVPSAQTWTDVRGWAWDALDVPVHMYEFALGNSPRISFTYNGTNGTMGLLYQMFYGEGPSTTNPTVTPSYLSNTWINHVSYSNDGGLTSPKAYIYDADGRATTLTSSTFGNETRSFDSDGNLTGVIEPSSYGSYGNITYGYYADGLRKTVGISASSIPPATSLQYSYRPDGLLQTELASWATSRPFSFTYSSAGRFKTETDPSTGQSITIYNANTGASTGTSRTLAQRQVSYDSYGRVSQMILPEGYTYGTFTYDGEDETTGYQLSNGLCNNSLGNVFTCSTTSSTHTYSARGELLDGRRSADGFLCTSNGSGGCAEGFDARSDMVLSEGGFTYAYDNFGEQTTVQRGGTITRTFDGDGHLVSDANNSSATLSCVGGAQYGCDPDNNWVDVGSAATYTWGTNGHPVKLTQNIYGGGPTYVSTYWDHWDPASNEVLFETSGGNNFVDLGALGTSNASNGATVEDRDPFGQVAATHSGYQFSAWSEAPAAKPIGRYGSYTSGAIGSSYAGNDPQWAGRFLDHTRPDAYVDQTYGVSFQGVRTADVNTTQWMTPDAFGGYGSDIMSQQPYLWNRNNGLVYADPSGYDPCGWYTWTDPTGKTGTVYAGPCPEEGIPGLGDFASAIGPSPADFYPNVDLFDLHHPVGGAGTIWFPMAKFVNCNPSTPCMYGVSAQCVQDTKDFFGDGQLAAAAIPQAGANDFKSQYWFPNADEMPAQAPTAYFGGSQLAAYGVSLFNVAAFGASMGQARSAMQRDCPVVTHMDL